MAASGAWAGRPPEGGASCAGPRRQLRRRGKQRPRLPRNRRYLTQRWIANDHWGLHLHTPAPVPSPPPPPAKGT
jgi:hypothetical protein